MTQILHRTPNTHNGFLFFALVISFVLALVFLLPINPNDYWWYVRIGGDIVSSGAIPTLEHLSYSQAGAPVTYQTWLASLIFWAVNQAGGVLLTGLLRGALVGGFYLCLWQVMRENGSRPKLSALVLLAAALTGSNNWSMRPQLFAYPLFGLGLWVISGWLAGKDRRLWLLPPLAALWINLHGSYPLLFVLLGTALIAGKGNRRPLLLFTGLAVLATFLNPLGPREWLHTISLMQNPSITQFSLEWQPPVNKGWQMNLFFGWLLLFSPLAALASKRPTKLEWLWFIGFGWMAFSGIRYIIWLTAVLAIVSARLLSSWVGDRVDRPGSFNNPALNLAIGSLILLLPFTLLPGFRQSWWTEAPPNLSDMTPTEAVAWLAARPELPGPLWSELAFSSYLTYALPERPVWIHTQFEIFPPEQFVQYKDISNASINAIALLEEEGINLLLLSREEQPALVQAVQNSSDW